MSTDYQGQMARGAVWMITFKWVERGLGLLSTIILVRLLTPGDYGIVAMALSFIFMAEILTAFNFDVALIQDQNATKERYNSAWTANVLLGLAITVLMLVLAWPISAFYGRPDLLAVVCFLAIGPLLSGLENIGVVAFRKELDFRREFIFQVSRKVIGFAVTVPLAFLLKSYWALAIGIIAAKLGGTLVSYWAHPYRPRFSLVEVGSLMRFSKWLLLNNLVNFFKERSTDFVVGRMHGAPALGTYNVSAEFASLPTNELGAPINRALLPGFAKIIGDPAGLCTAVTNMLGFVAMLALPVGLGICAVAPYLVPVVLGEQWLSGVPIMQVLSIHSTILVFHGTVATLLIAKGLPIITTQVNSFFVIIMLAAVAFLAEPLGPLGVALSVLLACVLTTPIYVELLRRHGSVSPLTFLKVVLRPLGAAGVMIFAVHSFLPAYHAGSDSAQALSVLIGGIALGAVTYVAVLLSLWVAMGRPDGAERQLLTRISRLWTQVIHRSTS
jgi:lipopolysaccharide exporter